MPSSLYQMVWSINQITSESLSPGNFRMSLQNQPSAKEIRTIEMGVFLRNNGNPWLTAGFIKKKGIWVDPSQISSLSERCFALALFLTFDYLPLVFHNFQSFLLLVQYLCSLFGFT